VVRYGTIEIILSGFIMH